MSSSGQLAYQLLGAIETAVIAYDDPRAGGAKRRTLAAPIPLLPPVTIATLSVRENSSSAVNFAPPFLVSSAYQFEAAS
jgi:hypothetical protein